MADGTIIIDTKIDNDGAEKGVKNLGNIASTGLKVFTGAIVGAGTSLGALGIASIKTASDLSEVQNVVDTTFGSGANKINDWANKAGASFGISTLQAKQFTGTLGAMLKSSGIASSELVGMSENVVGLAGDFASFYNLKPEEAFEKIRSGISGETEPLKQLGINMSVANLQAFALSKGIKKTYDSMSQAEQTTLRYNYLMSVSKDAQGDFAKTSDSFANQMRIASLNTKTLFADIGQLLLPVAQKAVKSFNDVSIKLREAFKNEQVKANIQAIAEKFGELVSKVATFIADNLPQILDGLNQFLSIGAKIIAIIAKVGEAVLPVLKTVFELITSHGEASKNIIIGLGSAFLALSGAKKGIDIINGTLKTFKDIKTFGGTAITSIKNIGTAFKTCGADTLAVGKNIATVTKNLASSAWTSSTNAIKTLGSTLLSAGKSAGTFALNLAKGTIELGKQAIQAGLAGIKLIAHKAAMVASTIATNALALAQAALNFVMSLNPITLIIIGIGALIAAIVLLWTKCDWFRNGVTALWEGIKSAFETFGNWLSNVFTTDWSNSFGIFGEYLNALLANVSNIWDSIKQVFSGVIDFISGVFTGNWSQAWQGVVEIFGGIFSGLEAIAKAPLNAVISLVNMAIDGLNSISVDIPSFVPGIGGEHFGVNIPKVDYLYTGGVFDKPTLIGGNTVVGDANNGRGSQREWVLPDKLLRETIGEEVGNKLSGLFSLMSDTVGYETAKTTANVVAQNNVTIQQANQSFDNNTTNKQPNVTKVVLEVDGKEFTQTVVAPHQRELDNYNVGRTV